MTREETIKAMITKALAITGANTDAWTREKEDEIWNMSSEWNSTHDGNEQIVVCEIYEEDGYSGDGFSIEDDVFYY